MKEYENLNGEIKLSKLTDIEGYLKTIEQPFLHSLQQLCEGQEDKMGWDFIDSNGEFVSLGNHISPTDTKIFTGRRLCVVACAALYSSLNKIVSPELYLGIVHTKIYFDMRYVRMNSEPKIYGHHFFLTLENTNTKEEIGIDPTYGQVNASYAGKFLVFNKDETGKYYSSSQDKNTHQVRLYYDEHPLHLSELEIVTYRINDELQFVLKDFQLPQSGYDDLVKSGGKI